jgi:hypothetical protein
MGAPVWSEEFPRCLQVEHSWLIDVGWMREDILNVHEQLEEAYRDGGLNYRRAERGIIANVLLMNDSRALSPWQRHFVGDALAERVSAGEERPHRPASRKTVGW